MPPSSSRQQGPVVSTSDVEEWLEGSELQQNSASYIHVLKEFGGVKLG